jgi:hypothetical protein
MVLMILFRVSVQEICHSGRSHRPEKVRRLNEIIRCYPTIQAAPNNETISHKTAYQIPEKIFSSARRPRVGMAGRITMILTVFGMNSFWRADRPSTSTVICLFASAASERRDVRRPAYHPEPPRRIHRKVHRRAIKSLDVEYPTMIC